MDTTNPRTNTLRRSSVFGVIQTSTNSNQLADNSLQHRSTSNTDKEEMDRLEYIRNAIHKLPEIEWIFVPEGFGGSMMIPMPNTVHYFSPPRL